MRWIRVGLAGGLVAALLMATLTAPPAVAVTGGPVSRTPAPWTPSIATSGIDGTVEQVRQLVPCGGLMYAVGIFTQIKQGGVTYARNNAFSFNATTGALTGWNPNVNGKVNSIALSANCATAYLGGIFTSVNGTAVKNLASVSTSTGAVNVGFKNNANGQVNALLVRGSRVLAGGFFTAINNSPRGYMASLNATTGVDDGYVNLNISGTYVYTDQAGVPATENPTRVYNYALSPDGTRLLVMGVFTSVGGFGRRQMVMLGLGATSATVYPWYSNEFNQNCSSVQPFWLQDASWAPDGSKIYIATTGQKPASGPGFNKSDPRAGLCDVAAAFPTGTGFVSRLWVNYTGCDTLLSTAADSRTAYFGGHPRWASNPNGCDVKGPGAIDAPGMFGLSPTTGALSFNPTRGRGFGADDMVVTPAGLWIASDNSDGTDDCGGVQDHAGICFLPYVIAKPRADYNGDIRADTAVWRPSTGTWHYPTGPVLPEQFGQAGDVPIAGDFTGTPRSDLTVFRPSTGQWFTQGLTAVSFGVSTDKQVAADYTGDGKIDIAVFRPSTGTWFVRGQPAIAFGASTDIPVAGDFTGDGRADIAVFRPSTGTWFVRGQSGVVWGVAGDRPIVADFTGDGKADIAVWRPSNGTWYIRNVRTATWGLSSDIPVAGDFTGDSKADISVWRSSDSSWYRLGAAVDPFGEPGDVPLHG